MTGKVHLTGNVRDFTQNKRLQYQKISTIRWLGANRPVAGAQAPNPAGSEANEDLTLLRRLLGVEPESQRLSAARFAYCTTGAACKRKWDAF